MKDRKASIIGYLLRQIMDNLTDTSLGQPIQKGTFRQHPVEPPWRCPKGYLHDKLEYKNFVIEVVKPEVNPRHRVILQLHGGGYIGPMKNIYRKFAARYSRISRGAMVVTIDYRVAPEYPFPAALDDAVAAYEWIVNQGFKENDIIVAGDSAGGGLALALGLYIRDNGMKMPAAFVTMSPWTDLTNSGISYKDNYEIDPLFGKSNDSMLFNSSYIGDNDPENCYISPMFGEFDGFPPMLIQVGTHEVLLSDSKAVAGKAEAAGVDVKLSIYEGMFHVFQMLGDFIPESKEAWEEVQIFINKIWP